MKMRIVIIMALMLAGMGVKAQDVVGQWKTIDDVTGKAKSVVEIFEKDGKYYGKVLKLFRGPDEEQDPVCKECDEDDDRYQQKVIGMEIIRGLEKDGDEYSDGTIMDPANGEVYDCKIWREGDQLKVRGYVAFFFRTQTWLPYSE
ncbi:DUF2147 domain-containing protein [Reichenbachiella ulvae]|uniref:DUF2147 domain-containing protein n=1 Tax=Reichenbachiella ulvae TaxID=2980104 RepID=A0ABT3CYG6_9BACT|nr:DUF2147 domain-containing protein [Reichenbachiella ulvae]MCV9388743.1 DUF2147 domain-containing protein [Reichenbachiella ulvae]